MKFLYHQIFNTFLLFFLGKPQFVNIEASDVVDEMVSKKLRNVLTILRGNITFTYS